MIAIAGAKGGCGKTTTTLGLARAFDRAGEQCLVIDADRQLPNLHAAAEVNREPTIASITDKRSISRIAQPLPGTTNTGILPAPSEEENVDLQRRLEQLKQLPVTILVDCPAGAGPDVVDPIAAADSVLVVTTNTKRSLNAAEKTIDIASRLGRPIAGGLVNKCERISVDFQSRFGVPLLATVPESTSPVGNDNASRAYDHVVSVLLSETETRTVTSTPTHAARLSTGIDMLDTELNGGLPAGSVVSVTAQPDSQSELLLHALTRTRGTLYLSTEQSQDLVLSSIESSVVETGKPTVRKLSSDSPLEEAQELLGRLPDGANVIVDSMDDLEQSDQDTYKEFMNTLMESVRSTNSIAMLHTLKRSPVPRNRSTTEHFVDIVFNLETTRGNANVAHELTIPKSRKDGVATDSVELDLTEALSEKRKVNPV